MKALLSHQPGGPDTLSLDEVAAPQPGPGQVRIAVKAAALNYPDTLIIRDLYQFKPPRPFAPGGEVAGVIDALGDGVTQHKLGDRVIALCGNGGLAEAVLAPASQTFALPDGIDFANGAALQYTYGTSYHALKDRGRLKAGETLLVLGAAGGVGLAAVELGKALGARVIAGVSSEAKAAVARSAGADEAFVYPRAPFDRDGQKALAELFKQACGANGADVVYDAIGGDYTEAALRAIAWRGRLLVVGFPAGIAKIPANLPLLKGADVCGVFWGAAVAREPAGYHADLAELFAMLADGRIKPLISERYPLARAAEGIAALESRQAVGKLVVEP
ncbi:MAG: NADPH:quinone oxidoreductase family protein [Proteobacteria bacterium]|nr:NADPH:quinone oxidoreductase family protein [Pseudomonadota bacterium]